MGRTGHREWLIGGMAVAVALSGTGVALTHGGVSLQQAATTVRAVSQTVIVGSDGRAVPARTGMAITPGTVVRTAAGGWAQLSTRSRTSYLAGGSALLVANGAQQRLLAGGVVADAQHGPGVTMQVADDVASVPAGSALEAQRLAVVRIGTLAGRVVVHSPDGRALRVPALYEATTTGDALPASLMPLALTDDAGEAAAVPTLVSDDQTLNTLAAGINRSGAATADTVLASWTGRAASLSGVARSERVLPVVIADATDAGSPQQRYDDAVGWRGAGGSWGVILHLLDGRADAVLSAFATDSRRLVTPPVATVLAAAGARQRVATTATGTTHPPAGSGSSGGSRTIGSGKPTPGGGTSPTPSPSHGPVPTLLTTGRTLIKKVIGLVPTPAVSGLLK